MKRRDFIKGVAGVATVAVAAPVVAKRVVMGAPMPPTNFTETELEKVIQDHFGLAPVKAEGTSVEYDPFPSAEEMEQRRGAITEGSHPKNLWPGIDEYFRKAYEKF
jgi:hypothetical protein